MITTYEQRLNSDLNWALDEGSMHFDENNAVHRALRRITARLTDLGVPHAVVGGMALFFHGFRRFTEDVDILVTRSGLALIHEKLEGLGYIPPFQGSKHLRDTELGVKVEFLVTGEYPGDGKPKPVAFPDPSLVAVNVSGIPFANLPTLIELKLASGMTTPTRLKDLADVQELIRVLRLPRELGSQLNPFVRDKFEKLWDELKEAGELE
ncbi:MAG TPA: hypothetical protein VKE40_11800 [Gemmataceae bacterium]|nr:hypothetical protein [Gemmataceae bacterium]